MNRKVYGNNSVTDVITLRYCDKFPTSVSTFPIPDGEFFINAEIAFAESKKRGVSFESEFLFYAAHASLHFLGFDDSTPAARALMFNLQRKLVALTNRD